MVRRPLFSLIAPAALALSLTALLTGFRGAAAGERLSRSWLDREEGFVRVHWVLKTEDMVACQTAAPDMRRALHQYHGRIRITTYLVGQDTILARSFLRKERLASVELVGISNQEFTREFAQRFPSAATPLVVVTGPNSAAVAFAADVRRDAGRQGMAGMMNRLSSLLQSREQRFGETRVALVSDRGR